MNAALRTLLVLLVGCGSSTPSSFSAFDPQPTEDAASLSSNTIAIWQGFQHEWTHNHRWNRFGNWIEHALTDEERRPQFSHAAASGSSSDTALFRARATLLDDPDVFFQQREVRTEAVVYEGASRQWQHLELSGLLTIALPPNTEPSTIYTAFLNGFDLGALDNGVPGKPIGLELQVGRAQRSGDTLMVPYEGVLTLGCSSMECFFLKSKSQDVRYFLSMQIGVLGTQGTPHTESQLTHDFRWDSPASLMPMSGHGRNRDAQELEPNPLPLPSTFQSEAMVTVIQGLHMSLSHWRDDAPPPDQHMLGWRSMLSEDPDGIDHADLLFKNWTRGMSKNQTLAYPEIGQARFTMDLAGIHLPQTSLLQWVWEGTHEWKSRWKAPESDQAVTKTPLNLTLLPSPRQ